MPELLSESESLQTGIELVSTLRGWHALEKSKDPNMRIIDFDFAPPTQVPQFIERAEVRNTLEEILESIKPDSPNEIFMHSRALAMITYLDALQGDVFDFNPYIERTLGVTPSIVSEAEIGEQYQLTANLFKDADVNRGYSFDRDGWKHFMEESSLSNRQIRDTIINAKARLEPIIMSVIGRHFETNSEPMFVVVNQPWICRVYGDTKGLSFEVNRHEKVRPRWYKGVPELLAVHERCAHLIQAVCYKRNVQAGLIPPALSQTTIPGLEQWADEGLADTLAYLVPDIYSQIFTYGQLAVELKYLEDLVNNNVHIWLNNPDFDEGQTREFALHYLPSETAEQFNYRTEFRRTPRYRSYFYSYYDGARYLRSVARILSPGQIVSLLEYLYTKPVTPSQTKEFVARLAD